MRSFSRAAAACAVLAAVHSTEPREECSSEVPFGRLFASEEELSLYKGHDGAKIYLAILGDVFDVSAGSEYYAEGRAYHHFAGADSSRAFTTGDANGAGRTDDIDGLSIAEVASIAEWHGFYVTHETYTREGRLVGRYYDATGASRGYFPWEEIEEEKKSAKELKVLLPGCNSKWSQDEGSVVWCTAKSGGVQRDWSGFPRVLTYANGDKKRCACVPPDRVDERKAPAVGGTLDVYQGCDERADECHIIPKVT